MEENIKHNYNDDDPKRTLSFESSKPITSIITFSKMNKHFFIPFLTPIAVMLSNYFFGELEDSMNNSSLVTSLCDEVAIFVHEIDAAQREITEGSSNGVHFCDFPITRQISQVDVLYQMGKPRAVGDAEAKHVVAENIFGRVVALGVDVSRGGAADVTHTARTGIGSDREKRNSGCDGVQGLTNGIHALTALCMDLCREDKND